VKTHLLVLLSSATVGFGAVADAEFASEPSLVVVVRPDFSPRWSFHTASVASRQLRNGVAERPEAGKRQRLKRHNNSEESSVLDTVFHRWDI
jgi:hypothetical protein